jgi:hypothetical protein
MNKKPLIDEQHCWQHILTKFLYETNEGGPFDCSHLLIRQQQSSCSSSDLYYSHVQTFLSRWPYDVTDDDEWPYDERLSIMYRHLIRLASSCSRIHLINREKFDFCYLHEYLVLALQAIAAGVDGQQDGWADLQLPDDEQ